MGGYSKEYELFDSKMYEQYMEEMEEDKAFRSEMSDIISRNGSILTM